MRARCRALSSRPCLTACQTLSSSRRCPNESRDVGLGVDAQFDFLDSLGLPSGVRLGPRPYREYAITDNTAVKMVLGTLRVQLHVTHLYPSKTPLKTYLKRFKTL